MHYKFQTLKTLFDKVRDLSNHVVKHEYGNSIDERLEVAKGYAAPLMKKIMSDIVANTTTFEGTVNSNLFLNEFRHEPKRPPPKFHLTKKSCELFESQLGVGIRILVNFACQF